MANTYLTKTFGSSSNRKTFTLSWWVKKSDISSGLVQIRSGIPPGGSGNFFTIDGNPTIRLNGADASVDKFQLITSQVFRDTSAWYHFVVAFDTTQATASNRIKFYVNGEQITSFSLANYPAQNYDTHWGNSSETHTIGANAEGNFGLNGYMSHIHYCDGTQYQASDFGEFDANGVWKIKTSPSVTYGNNGFFILKDGNSVTDQSGNGNNWSVGGGTLTNTEDNPSNVFNTMTALAKSSVVTLKDGGCTTVGNSLGSAGKCRSNWNIPQSGKWYCEYKMIADNQGNTYPNSGIRYNAETFSNPDNSPPDIFVYGTYGSELIHVNNGTNITAGAPASSGDIFGWCIDMDNGAIYIHQNGTYINSGNPTSGASKTGAIYTYTPSDYSNMCFVSWEFGNSETQWNFGNGYFSTTAVASAGTNASGIGIFEYDVPTGYTALSTKGLNL